MKCFVLEDSKDYIKVLRARLKKVFKDTVHCERDFSSAEFALRTQVAEGSPPELVFVDFNLTDERNGVDFIREAKAISPLSCFVLITDYDDPKMITSAQQLGALHITKSGMSNESFLDVTIHAVSLITKQRTQALTTIGRQRDRVFDLSAEIAHELRHRIGAIGANTRTLRIRAQKGDFVSQIDPVVERYLRKISETQDLCNILVRFGSSKRPRLNRSPTALDKLFSGENLDVDFPFRVDLPDEIRRRSFFLDPIVVTSIIRNLLVNAEKYGGVAAKASVHVELQNSGEYEILRITVDDTGPGIAPEHITNIFEPGERAGKPLDYVAGHGLGLGLSFCRNFADAHHHAGVNGSIRLAQINNEASSRFVVEIPGFAQ